jgi:hypothetical protein
MLFRNAHLVLPDRIVPRAPCAFATASHHRREQEVAPLTDEPTSDVRGRFSRRGLSISTSTARCAAMRWRQSGSLRPSAENHAAGGTTALALTLHHHVREKIIRTLHAVRKFRDEERSCARVLGVHIERAVLLAREARGAPARALRHPHPAASTSAGEFWVCIPD